MPHELEINEDGTANMVSARGLTPWHGLGRITAPEEGLLTAQKALELGGLDWTVEKMPIYVGLPRTDGKGVSHRKIDDKYAITRSTDQKVLGVVGSSYTPVQNVDAFAFVENLIDAGEAVIDTAGVLYGGKRIWISALLPETMKLAGEDYEVFVLFSNSFDGSKGVTVSVTPVRVVCRNTEIMATSAAKHTWSIHHRTNVEGKLAEARETLELSTRYKDAFAAEVEKLVQVEVNNDTFKKILEANFPQQKTQLAKNVEAVLTLRNETPTIQDDMRGTAWGAYNALTEFLSWKDYQTEDARMKMVMGYWQKVRDGVSRDLARVG